MKAKGKTAILLLTIALILTGCQPVVESIPQTQTVYATYYPIYALASMILEDAELIELHCLVQPQDGCLRAYQWSDWDESMLMHADLILCAGNGLEDTDLLEEIGEESVPVAGVMYGIEMAQISKNEDEDSHFAGDNPHLYMSVSGAEEILESIAATMCVLDAQQSELYQANLERALSEIHALEDEVSYATSVCSGANAAILNETLVYSVKDFGLNLTSWYERESGEMLYGDNLSQCISDFEESGVQVVLIEKQAPAALTEALEDAGFCVAKLDTMSTLSERDGADAYQDALKGNIDAIIDACQRVQE